MEFKCDEVVGNKHLFLRVPNLATVEIFVGRKSGNPDIAISFEMNLSTGNVKIHTYGNWKLSLAQLEWIYYRAFDALRNL